MHSKSKFVIYRDTQEVVFTIKFNRILNSSQPLTDEETDHIKKYILWQEKHIPSKLNSE